MSEGVTGVAWAMTTGEAGMASQALGLAEASGLAVEQKAVSLPPPWSWLPGHWCPRSLALLRPGGDALRPPWPDLLVTCGRRSVAIALAIRAASRGRTVCVHIQDPKIPPRLLDLVIAPKHDGLTGANVMQSRVALHRVTREKLDAAAADQAMRFAHLPRPHVAVLVGGASKAHRMTPDDAGALGRRLGELAKRDGAGLVVTPSRRTGPENTAALAHALADVPHWIWDGTGENPYFAMLGDADAIVATADSVSMVSEALASGKPVHYVEMPGGSRRFNRFYEILREEGLARPFDGRLERWDYVPPDDTARAAAAVRELLGRRPT